MQAVVDRHTSNGGHEPEVDIGKPNPSEMNEHTIQSVQQMLNQQSNKQAVNKLMHSSPQKLASNEY